MWSFLKKKCKCEDSPTNPILKCEHVGLNSNDIILCNLISCIGIEEGDAISIFFQKLENFLCGVGLTQYILDEISENPQEYSEFVELINSVISCDTIATCLLTTTSTTTIDPCGPCVNALLDISSINIIDDIKAIEINGDLITLNGGADFPIQNESVTATVFSGISDFDITITYTSDFPSTVTLFYENDECGFEYCQNLIIGTNTYVFPDVDLRCFASILVGPGVCPTTTTTSTTLIATTTTSTTTPTPTTTTTTTIVCNSYYYTVDLYLCEDCTITGGGTICNSEPLVIGKWYTWNNFKILIIAFNGCDSDPCESNIISTQQDDCESVVCPTTTTTTTLEPITTTTTSTLVPTTTTTITTGFCLQFTADGGESGGTLTYYDCTRREVSFELLPNEVSDPSCGEAGSFVGTGDVIVSIIGPC